MREAGTARQGYWRSLAEYARSPHIRETLDREFPPGVDEAPSAVSRRSFLQLLGASMALAGMSGCRWPKETIVPHGARPDGP